MNRKQLKAKIARLRTELESADPAEKEEITEEIEQLEEKLRTLDGDEDDEREDDEEGDTERENDEDDERSDLEETIGEALERRLREREERVLARVADMIGKAKKPRRRGRLPVDADGEEIRGGRGESRLFDAREIRVIGNARYAELPKRDRAVRNARSDEAMAAWIRAVAANDRSAIREIGRQLDGEFLEASRTGQREIRAHLAQYERATVLYGTPDVTSGLGAGSGGPLVPLPLASLIINARNRQAVGRSIFQRFESNAATLRVPTGGVATAAMVAENAQAAQGEPSTGSGLLSKKKAQSRMVASDEMLEDSSFNLVSWFSERAGSALGELEDTQFATSNGTAPNITQAVITGVTDVVEAVSGTLTYAEVVKVIFQVPKAYRRDAVWSADDTTLELLTRLVDGNGRPMFMPPVAPPVPVEDTMPEAVGSIMGKRVYGLPYTSGTLVFGAHRLSYGFLDGGGIRVKTSEHASWANDAVEFKFTERFDGRVLLAAALRKMTGLTTVA